MLLYGIAILLLIITALQYFGMARKKENWQEKAINRTFGIVFIGLSLQLILMVLSFFYLEGYSVDHSYVGNFENPSLIYAWLVKSSYISLYTLYGIFIYTLEKIRDKKIHVVPIICVVSIVLIVLLPYEIAIFVVSPIAYAITGLCYTHVLFTLLKWSKKELRAATSFIILGTAFVAFGIIFLNPTWMSAGIMPSIVIPLFHIIGTILCLAPTLLKPDFFSRSALYWYLFTVSVIGIWLFVLIFFVLFALEFSILAFAALVFVTAECLFALKSILKEEGINIDKKIDVAGIFTRPEKTTEEEVSISKEKKICLVCKGKISGLTFICSNCGTFYCVKCSEALTDLENVCWACDAPINPSKPVKLYEKEEEEIEVEPSEKTPKSPKTNKA